MPNDISRYKKWIVFAVDINYFWTWTQEINSVEAYNSDRGLHVLRPVIDLTIKIDLFAGPRF